ncbi:MAG: diaminopimelate decarboxylase [Syntrophomonadaceae bacterium]|nr:diaminopimelate decarboxylase [Syntrophomonadaceae bacterium]
MGYCDKVFNKVEAHELLREFGSPLYVYDEATLRQRCREMKKLVSYPQFRVNYSAKANTNPQLLKIVREEGLDVDAMSPGEMYLEELAGFPPERIMFIGNNVAQGEFEYAVRRGIYISVDSLSQLKTLGAVNRGGEVCLRVNPEVGAGHHEKVVTGGKKAKFGIAIEDIPQACTIADSFGMTVTGLNQHIGSLFLDGGDYLAAMELLLTLAEEMPAIHTLDFGGGFGIPYRHGVEPRLDLKAMGAAMDERLNAWSAQNRAITVRIEPGRYIAAECSNLLGTVTAIKNNYGNTFVGCDIGFNTLIRPAMYDSYHEIDIAPHTPRAYAEYDGPAWLVGPICESGDILAHDRPLPRCEEGDAVIIHDAGAYGYSMASPYNSRPLPAEVLIQADGSVRLIRRRQSLEELWQI